MTSILATWIGNTDLKAAEPGSGVGLGPIMQALKARRFDRVELINNYPPQKIQKFLSWLKGQTAMEFHVSHVKLPGGPTEYGDIYHAVEEVVSGLIKKYGKELELTFHLSPGTPAMAAVWIILGKTKYPAELIESSPQLGVRTAIIPFELSAEFIPTLLHKSDQKLERLFLGLPLEAPEFEAIIHRSKPMQRVIAMARKVAPRSIPVLIEGASGTGKELLARAIHKASPRANKPFVAVNCGAIPPELFEAEFFGYEKGSFTGATQDRKGHFESANEGSLFLDEIGELQRPMQVKLLRAIQEGEILKIGSSKPIKIDVRILAATNRNLSNEVKNGNFREDLFYRLSVAMLQLPLLKDRPGDLTLLIDKLLEQINQESSTEPGFRYKNISVSAKNLMLQHSWPGNIRELQNTLRRAVVWSNSEIIEAIDIRDAMAPAISEGKAGEDLLGHTLEQPIDLQGILGRLTKHYLEKAMTKTHKNKSQAANLLGLPNYQTLSNWLKKYKLEK